MFKNIVYFYILLKVAVNAFSISQESRIVKEASNSLTIESLNIKYDSLEQNQLFPSIFQVDFRAVGKMYSINFKRVPKDENYPIGSGNIFTMDYGKVIQHEINPSEDEKFELYNEISGTSIATLVLNKEYTEGEPLSNKFRIIVTVYDENLGTSQIFPVKNLSNRKKRNFDSFSYILYRQQTDNHVSSALIAQDYELLSKVKRKLENMKNSESKAKRAESNGNPFDLFIELLIVTDSTIYDDHVRFSGTNETDLVFLYMRTYFAHYINGVNRIFQNSFSNDSDVRITVKLSNFFFIKDASDSTWTDPALVGISTIKSYKGRQVIVTGRTLDAFKNFMNSRTLPFNYDYAVGLFNKDLWTSSGSVAEERSSARGFSYIGSICTDSRYSISEELGGFFYISIVAQQVGLMLGSNYDGDKDKFSINCQPSDNFLMTPMIGAYSSNIKNQLRLSSCSINAIKNNILEPNFNAVLNAAQCLKNIPPNQPYDLYENPGLFWTANDQCKMFYGKTASFCQNDKSVMCSSLPCRVNSDETTCVKTQGIGAAIGTVCDSGHICLDGECVRNLQAPIDNCPFGDDIVVNLQVLTEPLPKNQLTCEETLNYFSSIGRFSISYCNDENFARTCCKTCQKYSILTCIDSEPNCPIWIGLCGSGAVIGNNPVDDLCPRTCGKCLAQPLTCTSPTSFCKNGGQCQDLAIPVERASETLLGFECKCPEGYTGYMCEIKNPCLPNPCKSGGTCLVLGSNGYVCQCPVGCTGYDCSTCSSVCNAATCNNNGACSSINGELTCKCKPNFSGPSCATALPCSQVTCLNGGTCNNVGINAICKCISPWTGPTCDIIDDCISNPCKNSATCVSQAIGGYVCLCDVGFTGIKCEFSTQSSSSVESTTTPTRTTSTTTTTSTRITTTSTSTTTRITTTSTSTTTRITTTSTSTTTRTTSSSTSSSTTTTTKPLITTTTTTTTTTTKPILTTSTTTQSPICEDKQANCINFKPYCGENLGGIQIDTICPKTCNVCPEISTSTRPIISTSTTTSTTTTRTTSSSTSSSTTTTTTSKPLITTTTTTTISTKTTTTTQQSSTTPFNETCVDFHLSCPDWVLYCDQVLLNTPIKDLCPKSCGVCTVTGLSTTTSTTSTTSITSRSSRSSTTSFIFQICVPNPCQNFGQCIPISSTSAVCQCQSNFTGYLCEYRNPCIDLPCLNGGTCLVTGISGNIPVFRCNCPSGFSGSKCEINLKNQCIFNYCFNGGICLINQATGLTYCSCSPLYTGPRCETAFNPCWNLDNSPVCKNSGSCSINLGVPPYYQCFCKDGFYGYNCEFGITTTTLIATTPFTQSGPCIDTDENFCEQYSGFYCRDTYSVIIGSQKIPFVTYCRKSCNRCTSTQICRDSQVSCQNWAALNSCSQLAGIYPHPCPKSCGIC